MPIRKEEIFSIVKVICEEKEMFVTAKESIKGGLIAGGSTIIGGLLFGPPGMALGGGIGGLLAYKNSKNFHPVAEVLMNLPQKQKDYLQQQILSIVHHLDATDAVMLMALIQADVTLYMKIVDFIRDFVTSDLNMNFKS